MRFSFWPIQTQTWDEVLGLARRAEATGWDGVWFADHFMPLEPDSGGPVHEVWSVVSALAAVVPRIRIGPLVLGNTYRHPAVVAKMAASVDHVSGGRLVLGLGAGWQENEHAAYGLDFHTVGGRLRRLDEACAIIRSMFREPRTTFEGRYYRLADAPLEPKPIQDPLPLMIGGGGEKVTLRIVATHADEWNVWARPEVVRHKSAVLDRHCDSIGRDPAGISRSIAALVYLSDDPAAVKRVRETPQARESIAGNVEQMREIVAEYAALGVDEIIVPDFHLPRGLASEKLDFLDRFIEEVAPAVR